MLELAEGQTTHQSVAPFCQYVCDASEFYSKMADKWGKYLACLTQFLSEMSATEKNMVKTYRDLALPERRQKENHFGVLSTPVYEFLRTLE